MGGLVVLILIDVGALVLVVVILILSGRVRGMRYTSKGIESQVLHLRKTLVTIVS